MHRFFEDHDHYLGENASPFERRELQAYWLQQPLSADLGSAGESKVMFIEQMNPSPQLKNDFGYAFRQPVENRWPLNHLFLPDR